MKKYEFTGKTKEEAINNAKIELQELDDKLIIKEIESKNSLFSKKVVIEVIRKEEVTDFIKEYLYNLLEKIGIKANLEIKKREDSINIVIYSENNAILIGKNGKNMESILTILRQAVITETGENFKINIDINDYKEKQHTNKIREAKKIAREVSRTKIEAKLDPMNSYERRLIHEALKDYKYITTESVGEEPNRCLVIKPRED